MHFKLNGYIRRHTDEQLLDDLKKSARKLKKKTISNKQYRLIGAYSPGVITRRFGSWNKALEQAGLNVKKQQNIPIPDLVSNLHHLWTSLGRQPHLSDLYPPLSRFGRRPYLRAFGSWSMALETFVALSKTKAAKRTTAAKATSHPSRSSAPRSQISRTPNWRLRHLVMKRDNFRCVACGCSPANDPDVVLHIDHIRSLHNGGETTIENLQTLCSVCNIGKGCL